MYARGRQNVESRPWVMILPRLENIYDFCNPDINIIDGKKKNCLNMCRSRFALGDSKICVVGISVLLTEQ